MLCVNMQRQPHIPNNDCKPQCYNTFHQSNCWAVSKMDAHVESMCLTSGACECC